MGFELDEIARYHYDDTTSWIVMIGPQPPHEFLASVIYLEGCYADRRVYCVPVRCLSKLSPMEVLAFQCRGARA